MFLPLSLATLGPLPRQDIAAGSGFYNLTRQLGGSIGIAVLTTLLARREFFHRARLVEHVSLYNPQTNQRLDLLSGALQSRGIDPATAHQQALALIDQTINTQAAIMSYADIFLFVGVMFLASLPLLLFLGKGGAGAKAPSVH
jgi:DHA2 family multidrug resistance protein